MRTVLTKNWWAFAIRGVLGILFGGIAFTLPIAAMLSLVIVFAAYAIADGILAIVAGVRAARRHGRWLLFVLEGVAGIAAGVLAFVWPAITVLVFVMLLAIWALITGGLMLTAAFELEATHGRWWFVLGGAASLIYGALLIFSPMTGAVVVTWWIGVYALVFGVAMLVAAFRLRSQD
jgi:uncharacterized membrane protein HdeD (DUF308 family)